MLERFTSSLRQSFLEDLDGFYQTCHENTHIRLLGGDPRDAKPGDILVFLFPVNKPEDLKKALRYDYFLSEVFWHEGKLSAQSFQEHDGIFPLENFNRKCVRLLDSSLFHLLKHLPPGTHVPFPQLKLTPIFPETLL